MGDWIDYRELKRSLDFAQVLSHYCVEYKTQSEQAHATCPLPGHPEARDGRESNGRRSKPSFSAHLGRGVWKCFGCGQSGNLLEFIAFMENLNPANREEFRQAARLAQERFLGVNPDDPPQKRWTQRRRRDIDSSRTTVRKEERSVRTPVKMPVKDADHPAEQAASQPVLVNPPLDFALKDLDPTHGFFAEQGLEPRTVEHFGLGHCARGLLKGRIAIPLHDPQGQLVGYAGRLTQDGGGSGGGGSGGSVYRFPSTRERNGVVHEFRQEQLLYHAHQVRRGSEQLVVAEGFADVWHLWQAGHTAVVGTMGPLGSDMSAEQAAVILALVRRGGTVYVLPKSDEVGEQWALSVLQQVSPHRPCRWVRLGGGQRLTDVAADKIHRLLVGWSER